MAIALVVLYHSAAPVTTYGRLVGGWCGVDVFFVLSGYLITSLLLKEHHSRGRISLRSFYRRRVRRLGPALAALLSIWIWLSFDVRYWGGAARSNNGLINPGAPRSLDLVAVGSMSVNWFMSAGVAISVPLRPLWSLAVEEQFYLVWPAVVVLACRYFGDSERRDRILLRVALISAFLSAVECPLLWLHHHDQAREYVGTDTRLQGLMIGASLAIWLRHRQPKSRSQLTVVATAGGAAVALTALLVPDTSPERVFGGFTVLALGTAAVVCLVVIEPEGRLGMVLANRALVWAGRRSYAWYLWDYLVSMYANLYGWPGYIAGLLFSAFLPHASWELLEKHFQAPREPGATPVVSSAQPNWTGAS